MKKLQYIVHCGYSTRFKIGPEDLVKALTAHFSKQTAVICGRSVSGSAITLIEPDVMGAAGFNDGYIPGPQDTPEITKASTLFGNTLERAVEQILGRKGSTSKQLSTGVTNLPSTT